MSGAIASLQQYGVDNKAHEGRQKQGQVNDPIIMKSAARQGDSGEHCAQGLETWPNLAIGLPPSRRSAERKTRSKHARRPAQSEQQWSSIFVTKACTRVEVAVAMSERHFLTSSSGFEKFSAHALYYASFIAVSTIKHNLHSATSKKLLRGAPRLGMGKNKSLRGLVKEIGQIPRNRAQFRWETVPGRGTHSREGPMQFDGRANMRYHNITSGGRAKRCRPEQA